MADFRTAWIFTWNTCRCIQGKLDRQTDQGIFVVDRKYTGVLAGVALAAGIFRLVKNISDRTECPIGVEAAGVTWLGRLYHAVLPAITLSITGVANIAMHTREKMIDVMESDYMLFATARGESKKTMVIRHGLRNIALPAMTLQFASISEIIGGSVLVEQVFSYPGLGQAAVAAGTGSDVPLLLGITVVTAAVVFAGNFLANVLYGLIDPRMRKRGRKL